MEKFFRLHTKFVPKSVHDDAAHTHTVKKKKKEKSFSFVTSMNNNNAAAATTTTTTAQYEATRVYII